MALKLIARSESVHASCVNALRTTILNGELEPGDRLPPERELAMTLGVSRLSLRSALATLVGDGLIAVQHGVGYFVRDYRVSGTSVLPGLVELASRRREFPEIARELLRVRRHLAAAVLEALTDKPPSAVAVKRVAIAVDMFEEKAVAVPVTLADIAHADMTVIEMLLVATGSPVLQLCFNPILAVVAAEPSLRKAIYADPRSNVAGYRLMLSWLSKPRRSTIPELIDVLAKRDHLTVELLRVRRKTS